MLLICTAKNEILYELYSSAVSIQSCKAVLTVKNTRSDQLSLQNAIR